MSEQTKPDRSAYRAARRAHRASLPTQYRAPVAFPSLDDARHSIAGNANAGKRHLQVFDRDSATAKRDGTPTQGARKARTAPLGNRGMRHGSTRIPSLPLSSAKDGR